MARKWKDDCTRLRENEAAAAINLCLTRDELSELTGRRTRPAMMKTLRQMGLEFRVGGDGWPRVDREHYAQIMRGQKPARRRRAEPRFDQVKGAAV